MNDRHAADKKRLDELESCIDLLEHAQVAVQVTSAAQVAAWNAFVAEPNRHNELLMWSTRAREATAHRHLFACEDRLFGARAR